MLRRLRDIADEQSGRFESEAFTALFAMLRKELGDEYLASIQNHLTELKFRTFAHKPRKLSGDGVSKL
jgi:hypothetical protein